MASKLKGNSALGHLNQKLMFGSDVPKVKLKDFLVPYSDPFHAGPDSGWPALSLHRAFSTFHVCLPCKEFLLAFLKDSCCFSFYERLPKFPKKYGIHVQKESLKSRQSQKDPCWVLSPRRDLGLEYRNHILKFISMLRQPLYGLEKAADWLENLVNGSLPKIPLLDVSASLGSKRLLLSVRVCFIRRICDINTYTWSPNSICPWGASSAQAPEGCNIPLLALKLTRSLSGKIFWGFLR